METVKNMTVSFVFFKAEQGIPPEVQGLAQNTLSHVAPMLVTHLTTGHGGLVKGLFHSFL